MLIVTVEDTETGEGSTAEIRDGDYVLICAEPCHRAGVQVHAAGTRVITVKGHSPRPTPGGTPDADHR